MGYSIPNPSPEPTFDVRCVGGSTSSVLTLAMDTSLLESHLRALDVSASKDELRLPTQISTSAGPGFVRYLRFLWRELQRDDSPLHVPRVAREAEETLGAMLAEACGRASPEAVRREEGGPGAGRRLPRAEHMRVRHRKEG